ncbi:procathepsin L-like isoform X2 [Pygocentrus nattereri]|uniref:procathepsin L-like isoform X2 n=1 Tax=Pygocentrus nattereri TaxID=42514 RepID=UPI001891ECF2|nr:procathepsin L-like isoform X2 [Pygocentrus nattereri]
MRILLAVAALVVVGGAASFSLEDLEFHTWKLKFGKHYGSMDEESRRKMTWLDNRKLILEHNLLADQGLRSYRLGMNHFADMDNLEYQAMFKGSLRSFNGTKAHKTTTFLQEVGGAALPGSVDWREKGAVTEVKNQFTCDSCWAFSATGALEGQMFKKTGTLVSLSEQQLVDCSFGVGSNGCGGGWPSQAFQYVMQSRGLQTEKSYRYENMEGKCRFDPLRAYATCLTYKNVTSGDEANLQHIVASIGPVSVGIDISRHTFQLYESGVYDDQYCSDIHLNHAVLVVGYGTEEEQEYWLVKNSWGVTWGEGGYIKMSRNKNNQCGIATDAVYPEV